MKNEVEKLFQYCEENTTPLGKILKELERETHLKTLKPRMISGAWQGQLIRLLSKLKSPNKALEIGTFTGYASLCIADGLAPHGLLHTIEVNSERESLIRKYIEKADMDKRILLYIGDAKIVIPKLGDGFDFVFIDAAKLDNRVYFDMVLPNVSPGGLVLIDNVLWNGKVLDGPRDKKTQAIIKFNKYVKEHIDVETVMISVRDGLTLVRKL